MSVRALPSRWFVLPLLALFAACGSEDTPSPGAGGAAGKAGAAAESGAAGAARAGRAGENAGGTDAGAAGSDAGSGASSGHGEGAEAGSGGASAGRGGAAAAGGTDPGGSGAGGEEPAGEPAASVSIVQSDIALALGAEVTLGAEARDAQGNLVAAALTWRSSDASVASVTAGRVTGVALGRAEITASADGVTSAPLVVWVNPEQTTGSAIRDAVTAGALTEDEALVYRVFALFRDGRLPGEYWSTLPEDQHADHRLMFEVVGRFDELSPSHQQAVGSYLVPPAYAPPGSLGTIATLNLGTPPNSLAVSHPGLCSGVLNPGWESVATTHFRVWYQPESDNDDVALEWAEAVGSHAEAAYQELVTSRGFRPPVPDSGPCNGGDENIDIYLSPALSSLGLTTPTENPGNGSTSSAYIQIAPSVNGSNVRGTIAHEFMHVLQAAYANLYTPSYDWTSDGTATWAESILAPGSSSYQDYAVSFLTRVHEPLFFPNHYCGSPLAGSECAADPKAHLKIYGSYLFFQFLEHRAGSGTIKSFFENAAGDTESLHELSFVLAGQGGLTGIWAEFARTLWNLDPIPAASSFRGWDGQTESLMTRAGSHEIENLAPPAGLLQLMRVPSIRLRDGSRTRATPLNELSATYDHYRFEPGVRSVTFYNGFSLKLGKAPFGVNSSSGKTLDAGENFIVYDTTEEQLKGREVWALKKIDGTWTSEDWTRTPFAVHCLDKASERLEELVLIFSNGNYTTARGSDFIANAIGPLGDERSAVLASAAPCWKYKGNNLASLEYASGGDTFDVTNVLNATFVGEPHLGRAATALGLGYVFLGWRFITDPAAVSLTSAFHGTFGSCGESSGRSGSAEYGGSELGEGYNFSSFLTIPDGSGHDHYSGRSGAFQWVIQGCAGADKLLPAPAILDFDQSFQSLQSVERVGSTDAVLRGTDQLGPVVELGGYSSAPDVKSSWCFEALREGDPEPTTCD